MTNAVVQQDYGHFLRVAIEGVQRKRAKTNTIRHPSALKVWNKMIELDLGWVRRELDDIAHIQDENLNELRELATSLLAENV